jgi:hypothetical protein
LELPAYFLEYGPHGERNKSWDLLSFCQSTDLSGIVWA